MTALCFLIIFSFRRAVCKEQTLGKYKQCLFSYSYVRRDIIFPHFRRSPLGSVAISFNVQLAVSPYLHVTSDRCPPS